jgi:PIN domain nuclease of toxin-antitoxin system
MRLLLDTQLLLWAAGAPEKLSTEARSLIENPENQLMFSAVSLLELGAKRNLERSDLRADPRLLRRGLLDNGYEELAVTGAHALAVDELAPLHTDSFDRMLIAQATVEGTPLLTADPMVAQYHGPVRMV